MLMQRAMERNGVVIKTRNNNNNNNNNNCGPGHDVLRARGLVLLGVCHSISLGVGSFDSIGSVTGPSALVPGNVVALHSDGRFLRVMENNAMVDSCGECAVGSLSFDWNHERFLVVDAASDGMVAFYGVAKCCFLGMDGEGRLVASERLRIGDCPRPKETFQVRTEDNGSVSLYSPVLDTCYDSPFQVVQIQGFQKAIIGRY